MSIPTPLPGMPEPLDWQDPLTQVTIELQIEEILASQTVMLETLNSILARFNDLATEIRPTLDSLTNHPLIKMLSKKGS